MHWSSASYWYWRHRSTVSSSHSIQLGEIPGSYFGAVAGKTPFVNTLGVFPATRAVEIIRTQLGYERANVKLMAADGGPSSSFEGSMHDATEDTPSCAPSAAESIACERTYPALACLRSVEATPTPTGTRHTS